MSSASAATFVYVGNADSQEVTVLELKSSGELTPVGTTAVPGPAKPGGSLPLAVSPDKKRLYVGLRNEPYSAVTFAIDAKTGKLKLVGPGPLADSMAYIVADRSGKFLLSASYGGNKVTVNPIGADGIVQPAQQIMPTQPNAHCIMTDPSNRYVLHTSLGGDLVYQEKFDAKTGKLTPNDPPSVSVKAKAGARHLVFSPNKKFVYLVSELDGSIYVFPWDAKTGTLKKEVQVATSLPKGFDGKPWAADIHLTPDGKFLYASERTTSTLAAFSVDQDGNADCDRFLSDRKAAARLQHRSDRPLSAVGRPVVQQHDELRDRQKDRQAHQAEGLSDGQEPELGRDRQLLTAVKGAREFSFARASPHSRSAPARRIPCGKRPPARRRPRGFRHARGWRSTAASGSFHSPCRLTIPAPD
jgi:6-phosphogluconolactonase